MPEFGINLIRGQVLSPARRRARYWGMLVYLAIAGALLAAVLALSTSWIAAAGAVQHDVEMLESGFESTHPDQGGIVARAGALEREMSGRIVTLKRVDALMAGNPHLAQLMYQLVMSLPAGMTLRSLTMDAGEQAVTFELLVLGGESEVDPSGLVARLAKDAAVSRCLRSITYQGGVQRANGERNDAVWRFSARLVRRES